MRPVVALLLVLAMAVGSQGSTYIRIVYGSVDMVYEAQNTTEQYVIVNSSTHEVFCFDFGQDASCTDATAWVIIYSYSLSGVCSGPSTGFRNIYAVRETVVGSGPDGDLSMTIVTAPPPTPGPAPFPSYPNMYFRIVYGSVDMVYESGKSAAQYAVLNYSTREVFCFDIEQDTDAIAHVDIYSESLSGSCSGQDRWHTIFAAWETVVGSGPDGDLSMTIVTAPPPTPGPAPFPSYPNMYFRIVYGSVDMVYETQDTTYLYVILDHSTREVFCFEFWKKTDDIAQVTIYSESLSGSCSGSLSWHNIYTDRETVVGSGPDGDLSMTIVTAPPPTPGPAPFPSYPNYYFRIVYGSVDTIYETQDTERPFLILNYDTHEVFCFDFAKETDTMAVVTIYPESLSGQCSGHPNKTSIFSAWETVVGSGPDGDLSMTIVSAPPPTPGPAPFPSYDYHQYIRIVYGSVDMVYKTQDTFYQYVLNYSTHEVLCFDFATINDAISEVTMYSESLSGACLGEQNRTTIYAYWETDVGSGPDGDLSMTIVTAPPPTPGPAPFPSYPNMYVRIVYGSVDMVYKTERDTEQFLILNYSTNVALCFDFTMINDARAQVTIYSNSVYGLCSGQYSYYTIFAGLEIVVGSGPDGDLSMAIASAPPPTPAPPTSAPPTAAPTATPTAHPQTAAPTTPSPGSDDKLEIILIVVMSATIVVILLVLAIMMYKSRHPPGLPNTPVVDEDPVQTSLLRGVQLR